MTAADATSVAAWIIRDFPVPAALAAQLADLLADLVEQETLIGEVVEYLHCVDARPELVAFGLSGFLSPSCSETYLREPIPHFELVLLDRSRRAEKPTFLGYAEIARGNAGEGLTLFPLFWLQRSNDPADAEARELLILCHDTFLRVHRGYRIVSILKEASADRAASFASGGFEPRHTLKAGTPLTISERHLAEDHVVFVARKPASDGWPGSALDPLFVHRAARCDFTRAEQQVLVRAESDLTDGEIAEDLGVSANSVALRWRSIYARVAERVPFALDPDPRRPNAQARGAEKRRRVIAFVRQHPEELRPNAAQLASSRPRRAAASA